jgi:prepilin-type N-terminal cleavage/methylation domain-containing protein
MNAFHHSLSGRRTGFTLVELLVVIFIMLTLATLVVSMTPRFAGTRKLTQGAEQLQAYLLVAKQRARRDQLPTGVRLQPSSDNPNYVREVQFIQQPDPFSGGKIQYNPQTANVVTGDGTVDFTGGFPNTQSLLYPVQQGDFLEIKGGGLVHRIAANGVSPTQLTLESSPPNQVFQTQDYRILRQPRILTGETPLELPQDIAIDLTNGLTSGLSRLPSLDLMFAPSGAMIVQGQNGTAIMWVRDTSLDKPTDGDPILITVYTRTGLIAAHPINPDPSDYYLYTRDGRSSGL